MALLTTACGEDGTFCLGEQCGNDDAPCNGAQFAEPSSTDVEVYTNRSDFVQALDDLDCLVEVNFDDVEVSGPAPVLIEADHYLETHYVRISGAGSQYVHTDFGLPDDFGTPPSAPNMFAPGPMALDGDPGGFRTQINFERNGVRAGVAALSIVFVDADRPNIGPSGITVTGDGGVILGDRHGFSASNGEPIFVGFVATDSSGRPGPAIVQADIVNGNEWVGLDKDEDVALDDLSFLEPVPIDTK